MQTSDKNSVRLESLKLSIAKRELHSDLVMVDEAMGVAKTITRLGFSKPTTVFETMTVETLCEKIGLDYEGEPLAEVSEGIMKSAGDVIKAVYAKIIAFLKKVFGDDTPAAKEKKKKRKIKLAHVLKKMKKDKKLTKRVKKAVEKVYSKRNPISKNTFGELPKFTKAAKKLASGKTSVEFVINSTRLRIGDKAVKLKVVDKNHIPQSNLSDADLNDIIKAVGDSDKLGARASKLISKVGKLKFANKDSESKTKLMSITFSHICTHQGGTLGMITKAIISAYKPGKKSASESIDDHMKYMFELEDANGDLTHFMKNPSPYHNVLGLESICELAGVPEYMSHDYDHIQESLFTKISASLKALWAKLLAFIAGAQEPEKKKKSKSKKTQSDAKKLLVKSGLKAKKADALLKKANKLPSKSAAEFDKLRKGKDGPVIIKNVDVVYKGVVKLLKTINKSSDELDISKSFGGVNISVKGKKGVKWAVTVTTSAVGKDGVLSMKQSSTKELLKRWMEGANSNKKAKNSADLGKLNSKIKNDVDSKSAAKIVRKVLAITSKSDSQFVAITEHLVAAGKKS